jgi:hypothetical protein
LPLITSPVPKAVSFNGSPTPKESSKSILLNKSTEYGVQTTIDISRVFAKNVIKYF